MKLNPIQSSSAKFLEMISPIQSWSANAKSCRPIFILSHEAKNYWSYFAFSQIRLTEGKIVQQCFCLMRQNSHSVLAFPKFYKQVSISHQREKHCWSNFAIRRIWLVIAWIGQVTRTCDSYVVCYSEQFLDSTG